MEGGLAKDKNLKKINLLFLFFLVFKERVKQRGTKKEGWWVKEKM